MLEELVCDQLLDVVEKVRSGERLGRRDFLRLWDTEDLTGLGAVANFARERASGGLTIYRHQAHLNYTGRPIVSCPECDAQQSISGTPGQVACIADASAGKPNLSIGEMHISGGTDTGLGVEDLLGLVRRIRSHTPRLHLRAFSWGNLNAVAERDGCEPAGVLSALVEAGINSLAGGALADPSPEDPDTEPATIQRMERYIPWIRAAADLSLRCDFAWILGDGDEPEGLADLLLCVRELQDRWTVFETCTPVLIQSRSRGIETLMPTGFSRLRAITIARLFMDNIPHIQSPIAAMGDSMALAAQWYGADDVGGIPFNDEFESGSASTLKVGSENVIELIRSAGREPVDLYAGAR